jgi:hypothetical protein
MTITQLPQPDARGWLVFRGLPDDLRRAEDATAEVDMTYQRQTGRTRWSRLATDAERTLLALLGYQLPVNLHTTVEYTTASLRRRTWPTLEGQTP